MHDPSRGSTLLFQPASSGGDASQPHSTTVGGAAVSHLSTEPAAGTTADSIVLKGLKRLHEEEQTTPVRDSDGNTCPYPVSEAEATVGAMDANNAPEEHATGSAREAGDTAPQSMPSSSHNPLSPQTLHESRQALSSLARQPAAATPTSRPTSPQEQVDSQMTPLYSAVSWLVTV